MIALTILSAIAGGVCGILDGHTRMHKPRPHCYAEGGIVHKGEAVMPPPSRLPDFKHIPAAPARKRGKVIGNRNPVRHGYPIGETIEVIESGRVSHYCIAKGGLEQWVSIADLELI